jgi:hypothetical protein
MASSTSSTVATPERLEQAVGDEALDLPAHAERFHAERRVERHRTPNRVLGRALAGNDLDQGQ